MDVQKVAVVANTTTADKDKEIAALKKRIKELENQKKTRKLSAMNRFKKYIVGPVNDLAFAETDYIDLIPVDKMRLLTQAYPIVWEKMVLQPLYEKNKLSTVEEQDKFRKKKNIQTEYNAQVDNIIQQMKQGELDDQEHFREDLTNLLRQAILTAAESFGEEDIAEEETKE